MIVIKKVRHYTDTNRNVSLGYIGLETRDQGQNRSVVNVSNGYAKKQMSAKTQREP